MSNRCPKCNSPEWDYANIGFGNALVCTDCGHIFVPRLEREQREETEGRWPFPTLDNPLKPWDNKEIKNYEANQRLLIPDAPL